jgi:Secretion system C-terminal sorting domain
MKKLLLVFLLLDMLSAKGQVYESLVDSSYGVDGFVKSNVINADYTIKTFEFSDTLFIYGNDGPKTHIIKVDPAGNADSSFFDANDFKNRLGAYQFNINSINFNIDSTYYIIGNKKTIVVDTLVTSGFIVKYNQNGIIDSTFGLNGILYPNFEGFTSSSGITIAINNTNHVIYALFYRALDNDLYTAVNPAIVKLNYSGIIDTTWANQGVFEISDCNKHLYFYNNKLLIPYTRWATGNNEYDLLAKVNVIDVAMLTSTIYTTAFTPSIYEAFSPNEINFYNNELYFSGRYEPNYYNNDTVYFGIAKLNQNFLFDSNFGDNGIKILRDDHYRANNTLRIDFDSVGNIYATGLMNKLSGAEKGILIHKLSPNGQDDSSFGFNGKYILDVPIYTGFLIFPNIHVIKNKIIISGSWPDTTGDNKLDYYACRLLNQATNYIPLGSIDNAASLKQITAYPNPIQNGVLNISYNLTANQNISIELISLNGQYIGNLINKQPRSKGANTDVIQLPPNLTSGQYILRIATDTGSAAVKIIVQ